MSLAAHPPEVSYEMQSTATAAVNPQVHRVGAHEVAFGILSEPSGSGPRTQAGAYILKAHDKVFKCTLPEA